MHEAPTKGNFAQRSVSEIQILELITKGIRRKGGQATRRKRHTTKYISTVSYILF
jgi:hypothetical protein